MPMSVNEQSSSFSKTTKKSVQVMQSSESFDQQQQQQINEGQSAKSSRQDSLCSSTSGSSLASDSTLRDMQMGLFFKPTILNFDSMMGIMGTDFEDCSRDVFQNNETFEVKLDVNQYLPEEIKVKVSDNLITVSAKQEQKSENNFSSRQFSKKFSLPPGVKPESITCNLTTQGQLRISAPIEKTQQSITSTAQHKQLSKTQAQESTTSSRKSSINSDVSSIRDLDEFILRPRRLDLSSLMSNTMMGSEVQNLSREVCNINDGKKFEMKLEVKNFKAEEVQVKITKNLIKIEGKHESEFASRSFNKEFTIPYGVKADTIQCTMNDDGVLTISAPIQQQQQQLSQTQQRSEQQVTSSVSSNVQQQHQQQQQTVQKKLQETGRMDSTGSTTTSSIRETSKRLEDMILRPTMNFDFDALMNNRESIFEDVSKQVCHVNEGKKFELKFDIPEYQPEELKVKIANNMVIIEAKQETSNSSRQFYKKFSIPQGVKPESITSSLSPQGVLTISAPIDVTSSNIANRTEQVAEQHQTQTQSVRKEQQHQQHIQQQQQNVQQQHSDSNTSISSNLSSLSSKLDRDFILRPIMNIDFDALMGNRETLFEDVSKRICHLNEGKKFEIKLEVVEYQPEEIQVKIANNMVIIEAKQETSHSSRQFYKKFSIPHGVKPESITSSLSPQGILTISAPIEVTSNVTSANRTEQVMSQTQQTQSQSVRKEQQQQLQQQQHSDSNTSINSNISNISSAFDRDFILRPIMDFDAIMAQDTRHFEDISKSICQVSDGKKFETKISVPGFEPSELTLKVSSDTVTISGKQEMRQENNFSSKTFLKKFSIPFGVKPENITSSLSPAGVLTISAPITETNQQQIMAGGQNSNANHTTVTSSTSVTRSEHVNVSGNQRRPQIVLKPKLNMNNMISSVHSSFEDVSKDLYHVCDGQTFEMKLLCESYLPNEIDVKISENIVTIEGKQEMRQENNFKSRQFCKKFTIPAGVKPESITCSLNGDGTLIISAPIVQSLAQNQQLLESQNQQVSQSTEQSTKKVSQTFSSTTSSTSSTQQQQQQLSSTSATTQQQLH